MKFFLLLSAVAFLLVTVDSCDQIKKRACMDNNNAKTHKNTTYDNCRSANYVRVCALTDAGCSEDDANKAASELVTELKMDCMKSIPNWEKDGKCITREEKCGNEYNATIQKMTDEKMTDNDKICDAIEVYQKCMTTGGTCKTAVISAEMKKFLRGAKIEKCEKIHFPTCEEFDKYETCLSTFEIAVVDLDLKTDEETLCMLARAVEHCFRKQATCDHQTTKVTITKMLNNVDCSEYVDLCDHSKEEWCTTNYVKDGHSCGNLKDYRSCLSINSTCPVGRIHNIIRKVMNDENIDCADSNACELVKETNCDTGIVEVDKKKSNKEEKCILFNQYQKCMVRAKCNTKYMDSKVKLAKDQLGNPCGASSILASIGLTLLLAAVTGQWK